MYRITPILCRNVVRPLKSHLVHPNLSARTLHRMGLVEQLQKNVSKSLGSQRDKNKLTNSFSNNQMR